VVVVSEPIVQVEYSEDDFQKGYGVTWMRALDGDQDAPRREPSIGAGKQASLADWAGRGAEQDQRPDQRVVDIYALEQILASTELRDSEEEAFEDMLDRLKRGRYPLTEKQRDWVLGRCNELDIDPDPRSHEERNKHVPRGSEVEVPVVLQSRPAAPPRRGPKKVEGMLICEVEGCGATVWDKLAGKTCSNGHTGIKGRRPDP
jgi:hypothetical protein